MPPGRDSFRRNRVAPYTRILPRPSKGNYGHLSEWIRRRIRRGFDDRTQPGRATESGAGVKEAALGSSNGDVQQASGFLHGALLQLADFDDGADARTQTVDGVMQDTLLFGLREALPAAGAAQ